MTEDALETFRRQLAPRGYSAGPGMTEEELAGVEHDYGFQFPPDLRQLLGTVFPRGEGFPDWRSAPRYELIEWLDEPADAIAESVELDGFWLESWGPRPEEMDDAVEEALRQVALAPLLIPVFQDLYLPSRPSDAGNPVLSLGEHGVRTAAVSLAEWLSREFGIPAPEGSGEGSREIEFWTPLERLLAQANVEE
jgi:hypothetical protein